MKWDVRISWTQELLVGVEAEDESAAAAAAVGMVQAHARHVGPLFGTVGQHIEVDEVFVRES